MNKIIIWLKIGKVFIDQESIRGLKRKGPQTQISLFSNQVLVVNASYDKIIEMLPSGRF
ncbi:MAG: hypothetical protein H0V01_06845 [Bacteroidetes bacterium]|nr:hypothetical protein [Bacteroidota bacterium]HET6244439.1 hypothetical protein [Bacteroidia bacterium]